jgi:hypothetical protein
MKGFHDKEREKRCMVMQEQIYELALKKQIKNITQGKYNGRELMAIIERLAPIVKERAAAQAKKAERKPSSVFERE